MTAARYGPTADVGWVCPQTSADHDAVRVYLAKLPLDPPLVLEGTAAIIWLALAPGATLDEVTDTMVEATGSAPHIVAPPIEAFVRDLVQRGLVAELPGA